MNIGLALAISLIFFALNSYYSDPLIMGIAFMVSGTVLFVANFYITKHSKAKAEILTESSQEVQDDENLKNGNLFSCYNNCSVSRSHYNAY